MRVSLQQHPGSRSAAIRAIDVDIARKPDGFVVRYRLVGAAAEVKCPMPRAPQRADDLWRTTCFEAFLARADGGYYELNFSPSTEWAAYRFDGYRTGMRPTGDVGVPQIEVHDDAAGYELVASFGTLPNATRLALSAIVEDTDGTKSYWALAHPASRPDFHHAGGFALDLLEPT